MSIKVLWLALAATAASAATLSDVCTASYVKSVLPSTGFLRGVTILTDSLAVNAVTNYSASQQVIHLFSALVEITNDYYPSSCEMARINNDTIASCDLLDGKKDGVVSRTDLCKLHYNATSATDKSYSCAASSSGARGGGRGPGGGASSASPAASGTVTAAATRVAADIWRGLFDSKGRQVYISFQPSADFGDAATTYNNVTRKYEAAVSGIGVQWVNYFLKETKSAQLSLANATYDTLRTWILEGMQKYADTLQTNWPDLGEFRDNGGKIIHYHGESDPSIPSGSSVIYHDAVRRTMYPDLGFNESYAALNKWYRFFLVPGAGHCGRSSDQPNGPFPADVLGSVIAWVEKDKEPSRLNATVPSGASQSICTWPLRPYWSNSNASDPDCVFDQASIDSWLPKLDSIPVPVW